MSFESTDMQLIHPIAGRLLVRQLCGGAVILGVLQFGEDFVPTESALYPACWVDGHVAIGSQALDKPSEHHEVHLGSACTWVTQQVWRAATVPGQFTIRFVEAFPGANQWTAVAVSSQPLPIESDSAGHAWFDVTGGVTTAIAPPIDARGEAVGGLLSLPLWPAPDGSLATTAKLPSWQRPLFVRQHHVLASVGRGDLTVDQAREQLCADPLLRDLCGAHLDIDFARFLAQHPEPPTVERFGPRSQADYDTAEALTRSIVRQMFKAA